MAGSAVVQLNRTIRLRAALNHDADQKIGYFGSKLEESASF